MQREWIRSCIIHTSRRNKFEKTKKTVKIIEEIGLPETLVVMDHASLETTGMILEKGYIAGLTVQNGKLKPQDVFEIVERYGVENLVLNSDTGFQPSDTITVSKTVKLLSSILSGEELGKIAWNNATETFRIA